MVPLACQECQWRDDVDWRDLLIMAIIGKSFPSELTCASSVMHACVISVSIMQLMKLVAAVVLLYAAGQRMNTVFCSAILRFLIRYYYFTY